MSQFAEFNPENKLRIPLSMYAAQIIETDCSNFSLKKTTLINTIILNYYQVAQCSIGLRLKDYQKELSHHLNTNDVEINEKIIRKITMGRANDLIDKYTKRKPFDVNWQITLNKKVKHLLTEDPSTNEELYYGNKPGHYIRSLIEEYTQLPYYQREAFVFQHLLQKIEDSINNKYLITLTNNKHVTLTMKPYKIISDPLSMYHYLVGFVISPQNHIEDSIAFKEYSRVQSIRISRLTNVNVLTFQSATISPQEEKQILAELDTKGVQFVCGDESVIKIRLSDYGIKKYESQIHLRPVGKVDPNDSHLFTFECTEAQILYYFFSFGHDAKILYPDNLAEKFKNIYQLALSLYET